MAMTSRLTDAADAAIDSEVRRLTRDAVAEYGPLLDRLASGVDGAEPDAPPSPTLGACIAGRERQDPQDPSQR